MDAKARNNEKTLDIIIDSQDQDFYLSEDAKNWEYSDFVRVTSSPRGMVLSFGKFIRENKKFGIFKEIMLPYDVVEALMIIMQKQFDKLIKDGSLKKSEDTGPK